MNSVCRKNPTNLMILFYHLLKEGKYMTDIELVIKIPEKLYKDIQSLENVTWANGIYKAVHNGIPLSKEHGRLLDEKDILDTENNDGDWYDLTDMPDYIAGVKAIIEASSEEEE